jgi:Ca2+-binding EF-hand superfamily protein
MRALHWSLLTCLAMASVASSQAKDLANGPVSPYNAGDERSRFLAAVGLDNELSAQEFQADLAKGNNFVRSFDNWQVLLKYDANKDNQISWIEADAYRMDLSREAVKAYDANGDRRIHADERAQLNADLAAGKLPGKFAEEVKPSAKPGGRKDPHRGKSSAAGNQPRGAPNDAQTGSRRQRMQEARKKMVQEMDTDGDGDVSRKERQAWRAKKRQEWQRKRIEKYDTDGDGQLSQAEREAKMQQLRQEMMQRMRERLEKKHDANKDGQLSAEEGAKVQEEYDRIVSRMKAVQDARRAHQNALLKRFDADGNGELSKEEKQTMSQTLRDEGRRAWEAFSSKADADGDGTATREERRDYFRKLTAAYDADGDGRLSPEEWRALAQKEGYDPRRISRPRRGRRKGPGND